MRSFFIWLLVFVSAVAQAQTMGGSSGPVIWSGSDGKVLPSSGLLLPERKVIKLTESTAFGTNYISLQGSSNMASNYNFIFPSSNGNSGNSLINAGAGVTSWGQVDLSNSDAITGVLPTANGGTEKALGKSAGSVVYSDTDSFEYTAVGTTGQYLQSNGTGGPTWSAVDISTASITGTLGIGNGGTGQTTKGPAFNALSPMTTAGDIIYGGASGTGTRLAAGTSAQVLHSGTTPSWGAVSLTADVSGVLPLANGGTNANLSASAGSVIYSTASAHANSAVGTSGDWLLSGGTGAPTFSSTVTTAKTIDGSADAVQLTVEGHSTQTSNILAVQKSDTTNLLAVTNANGTKIRGTTTNDNAASGFVGEYVENITNSSESRALTNNTYTDIQTGNSPGLTLTAGDWDISMLAFMGGSATGTQWLIGIGTASGHNSTGLVDYMNVAATPTVSTANSDVSLSIPSYRVSISSTTTYYGKVRAKFTVGSPIFYGHISARRVR